MAKYYRVKKDTFMWKEGAILQNSYNGGYVAIEDIWNKVELNNEYISAPIIENEGNSEFFERVYPDTLCGSIFRTADQLREVYKKSFK
jgi:hypothetical protein